jgi:hypothetical protein
MKNCYYLFAAALVLLAGCGRWRELQGGWQSEKDNALVQELFDDIYRQVDDESQQEDSLRSPVCPAVSVVFGGPTVFPATLSLDFGAGCLGPDGRNRSGSISAVYSGPWRQAGTTISLSLDQYRVNGYLVEGNILIINNGLNLNNQLTYTLDIQNGRITDPDGAMITYSSTRTYTWVEGQATTFASHGLAGIEDDVYLIQGTANGVNREGRAFSVSTPTPLRRELDCRWIVSGVLQVTPQGFDPRTLDFGNGSCDNQATASVAGYSIDIYLP